MLLQMAQAHSVHCIEILVVDRDREAVESREMLLLELLYVCTNYK